MIGRGRAHRVRPTRYRIHRMPLRAVLPTGEAARGWEGKVAAEMASHTVELMVRTECGSCDRVAAQIAPVVAAAGAELVSRNVDHDAELAAEFGDRVPVVVIDEEEFACWEVDNEELAQALLS